MLQVSRQEWETDQYRREPFTALLRLRQACCDLRLLGIEDSPSSRLNALLELVGETIDGGHRALIFSQFTAMLV
jgi:SNF2 family DNA or RNA helicase